MDNVGYIGPLMDRGLDALSNDMHLKIDLFAVSVASVREFWMGVDSWVEEVVTDLEDNIFQLLFCDLCMV